MNHTIGNLFKGDKVIWMVFLFLCLISIIEVFSASSTLSYKTQDYLKPLINHSTYILIGLCTALFIQNIPCRYFKVVTPVLLVISYFSLGWVLFGGESINGANRVIKIVRFTFQPSELAKVTLVLATAQILSAMQLADGKGADKNAMKYVLFTIAIPILLIAVENLSTAALICIVIFLMMFIARVPLKQLGKLIGFVLLLVALVIGIGLAVEKLEDNGEGKSPATAQTFGSKDEIKGGGALHRFTTWKNRILNHSIGSDVPPEEYDIDKNFQVGHANIAIASSGGIGKGPGNSTEREYLPQAFSDFIYAIIIEEMGILGAIAVVFLYIILLFRAARIAGQCENNFPAFLVLGLSMLLVIQATINMMVAVGLFPVTGQPLPLISKGGNSTIFSCASIGAILSVSRWAQKTQTSKTPSNTYEDGTKQS